MPALYTITTRASGTILTAAIYNADHQNHVNNGDAQHLGGYSTNVAQMQTISSPGDIGSENLAAGISDELAHIRYIIQRMRGSTYWYSGTSSGGGGISLPSGAQYQMLRFNATPALQAENAPYDLCFSTGDSLLYTNGQVIVRHVPVHSFLLPASLTGSFAACIVAPTGSITFTLAKNGTGIGSINIAAGSTSGTFTFTTQTSFVAATDIFTISAPATADATLAGLYASLMGQRQ